MKIDFCLPVYNEEKILEENTLRLYNYLKSKPRDFTWKIVILINHSQDKSLEISKKLAKLYPEINYCYFTDKGKGLALKKYFNLATEADVFFYMDIDLAVSLEAIEKAIEEIKEGSKDLVWGSRLLKDSVVARTAFRSVISKFYNKISRVLLDHDFLDVQCGFKVFRKRVWDKLKFFEFSNDWFFDAEFIGIANKLNFNLQEIEVNWREDRYKKRKSKLNVFKHSFSFLKKLFELRKKLKQIN